MTQYWEPGTQYDYGSIVLYQGHRYKIIQPHRSQGDWTPDITPALWGRMQDEPCDDQPQYQQQQQQQQPYHETKPESYQPAQPGPQPTPDKPTSGENEHWWQEEKHKKELEVGGGLLAGALAIGAGVAAYKHHENKKHQTLEREDWIRQARARTEAFNRGAGGLLGWVLTNGRNIPRNAIEGGRDERGEILYVARAFQEGGLHPGKACTVYRHGGLIGHKLHAVEVDEYEILVGEGSAVLWVDHRELSRHGAPRPVEGGHEDTGAPLYIAQAHISGGYHPGKSGGDFKGAFVAIESREVKVENYSVLCHAN